MGEVVLKYKVMPDAEQDDVDATVVAAAISALEDASGAVQSTELKPLAFGLQYVEVQVIIQDEEGAVDRFEDAMKAISGVGEIEVLEMGRLL